MGAGNSKGAGRGRGRVNLPITPLPDIPNFCLKTFALVLADQIKVPPYSFLLEQQGILSKLGRSIVYHKVLNAEQHCMTQRGVEYLLSQCVH